MSTMKRWVVWVGVAVVLVLAFVFIPWGYPFLRCVNMIGGERAWDTCTLAVNLGWGDFLKVWLF